MKVKIVFDLDEFTRRAIANRTGDGKKPADYESCKTTLQMIVDTELEICCHDLEQAEGKAGDEPAKE